MPVNRPDGSPDVEATYARFEARLEQGDQEGALADARWYWHNALELGVGQGGVRLSYFLFPTRGARGRVRARACVRRRGA
jgi:hypothetical protein